MGRGKGRRRERIRSSEERGVVGKWVKEGGVSEGRRGKRREGRGEVAITNRN
jgi:hypothetical protein